MTTIRSIKTHSWVWIWFLNHFAMLVATIMVNLHTTGLINVTNNTRIVFIIPGKENRQIPIIRICIIVVAQLGLPAAEVVQTCFSIVNYCEAYTRSVWSYCLMRQQIGNKLDSFLSVCMKLWSRDEKKNRDVHSVVIKGYGIYLNVNN